MNNLNLVLFTNPHDDWEGLYLDGNLIEEDHQIGGAFFREYWISIGAIHGTQKIELREVYGKDAETLNDNGNYPMLMTEFKEKY